MQNKDIVKFFQLAAQLGAIHEDDEKEVRMYGAVASQIEGLDTEVSSLSPKQLASLFSNKIVAEQIQQLLLNNMFNYLEKLLGKTPPGIIQLLEVNGLGPKKVHAIWKTLNITTPQELLQACENGLIAKLKGFGEKTQESIKQSLLFIAAYAGKALYADIENNVLELDKLLRQHDAVEHVSSVGAVRRKMEIIDVIEFLVATKNSETVSSFLKDNLSWLEYNLKQSSPFCWRGKLKNRDVQLAIYFTSSDDFFKRLFTLTGSPDYLEEILSGDKVINSFSSEEEIYKDLGFTYLDPEMREKPIFKISDDKLMMERLVALKDLKGIIHAHSTYSDGKHALEEMASFYKALGYEYLGITDHSKSAFYANGLSESRVKKQHDEIDLLNKKLYPFFIFKGIESDILSDGSLDYSSDVLSTFDFVIASIHSAMNMSQAKATERLIKAIQNPFTTILGHPTGRLLLKREGYLIDHRAVIEACSHYHVAIEINSNPWRLDLDWRWIEYAMEKNVSLCICPDAHEKEAYLDMSYGIIMARKGGLLKDRTLNALSAFELQSVFKNKRIKK